jgi:hypothetical protein
MNINEIKNKLNDVICELVEETVKRELKHEKIEEIKSEQKPKLEPGDICEINGKTTAYFARYKYDGTPLFVINKKNIEDKLSACFYDDYKLIKKANPKNKIVIARGSDGELTFLLNPEGLWFDEKFDKWAWEDSWVTALLFNTRFPEIKPGEKIEIEF